MATHFGLLNTETFEAERFKNWRRAVQYQYPNGAGVLAALSSLLEEESTDDPEFNWYEDRMVKQRSLATAITGNIVYLTASVVANPLTGRAVGGTWTYTTAAADITVEVPTTATNKRYGIKVANVSEFREGHVILISTYTSAGQKTFYKAVVENIDRTNSYLGFRFLDSSGTIDYDHSSNKNEPVWVIGSSFAEGSLNESSSSYTTPVSLYNYTQIFRTPYSYTGTAGKTQVKYDEMGTEPDLSKKKLLEHMIEMEKAFLFGSRTELNISGQLPQRTTGGIYWHLQQWELTSNNPYGETGATSDSDDNKRIINSARANLAITESDLESYIERAFRNTNTKTSEKLALCGSGFLSTLNQLFKSKTVLNADIPVKEMYGMAVVKYMTPFGTLYLKTHPLFTQNPTTRYSAMLLDMPNLRYRYIDGRDTFIRPEIQPNDADYRTDEWFTEAGLEVWFPETFMFLWNFTSYA